MIEDSAPPKQKRSLHKRFYKDVVTRAEGEGVAILLDGKPIRTPAKAKLVVPSQRLAEAIAEEWRAQKERIDPETMRLTKLANSAIDGVRGREDEVRSDILSFAGSDLLCYRAEGPEGLVATQTEHWDPVLAWAKQDLRAPLRLAQGVVHVDQPEASIDHIGKSLHDFDEFGLTALHIMTTLTGSALLALAVVHKSLTPDQAWAAAHVDEDWQISQWGQDEEAAARRARRRREFEAAARMLPLLENES